MPERPLTVLDELEIMPGQLDDFLAAMRADYQPGAEARGMTLEHVWITPPFERPEGGTTVILVWHLAGAAGFWAMRSQSSTDEVASWWRRCNAFIVSRTRRIAAEWDDLSTHATIASDTPPSDAGVEPIEAGAGVGS